MVAWQTISPQFLKDNWIAYRTEARRTGTPIGELVKRGDFANVIDGTGAAREAMDGLFDMDACDCPPGVASVALAIGNRCGDMSCSQLARWLSIADQHDFLPSDDEPGVRISTIHSAKGLEWPCVIVGYCNDGRLPLLRRDTPPESLEEEHRVMYVAMTRARDSLRLHYSPDSAKYGPPSRYLECGVVI